MVPNDLPRPNRSPASPDGVQRPRERGQAMVEFAAVLLPILLLVVGIIQFGLIFGANVTLTNAAREGARAATIARYDIAANPTINDIDRCNGVLNAARNSFGIMNANSPNFTAAVPCTSGSATDLNGDGRNDRWVNGDLTITLCSSMPTPTSPCPTAGTYCTTDDPAGCLVRVELTYHSDIIVPFIGQILATDGNGRFEQRAVAVMVIN